MLVKHLIELLRECPPDLEVDTEGCDCEGDSFAVVIEWTWDRRKRVLIRRPFKSEQVPRPDDYDNAEPGYLFDETD